MSQYSGLTIRFAESCDAAKVVDLRMRAYTATDKFAITDPAAVTWRATDEHGCVLVAETATGDFAATITGFCATDAAEFKRLTNVYPPPGTVFPVYYFTHGCTDFAFRKRGLNTLLKVLQVQALAGTRIQTVGHNINVGSRRVDEMAAMGFQYHAAVRVNAQGRGYEHRTPLLAGIIGQAHFAEITDHLETRLKKALTELHIHPGLRPHLLQFLDRVLPPHFSQSAQN
ncbi:MAG: hypothetical protein AAF570_06910 [Bacteroidota bacterium]